MKRILWAILLIAISTNLPAPLFPYYQTVYNLDDLAITTLFAIYAACLLPILLISSSLASRNGLRVICGLGLSLAFCSALFFSFATAAWHLYTARVLEGFAVGAFMGTSNALLLQHTPHDINQSLKYSSMCNMFGFGFGPLLCGLILQYSPILPHRLPYLLLLSALISAILLLFTLERKPETLNKSTPLHISLCIASESRKIFWLFIAPAAFAMLALNGIVISLIPTYMKVLFHSNNSAFAALLLFLMLSGSGIAQISTYPDTKIHRIQFGICFLIVK